LEIRGGMIILLNIISPVGFGKTKLLAIKNLLIREGGYSLIKKRERYNR